MEGNGENARNGTGRVADYFVVVGANSEELRPLAVDDPLNANDPIKQSRPLEMVFEAEIVSQYPLVDHECTPFPDGLTLFCLPDGLRVSTRSKPPSFFSFVQTSDKGSRLIGSCLTFYEKLNESQRDKFLALCHDSPETMSSFPDVDEMRLYVPRCLCIISQWPFVESFRKFLCHIYRLSLSPCSIPIERYICNFIDDVPVPPSGKVEVSYLVPGGGAGDDSSFIFKRPPINEPNAWSTLPMKPLFDCLSIPNILSIFSAVLVERSIVFISSQNHLMASAAETIISLMYPLQWSHVYIPILPRSLLGVLSAPVPLIVGLNSTFLPPVSGGSCSTMEQELGSTKEQPVVDAVRTSTMSSDESRGLTDDSHSNCGASQSASSPLSRTTTISTAVNVDDPPAFVDERYYAVFQPETIQVYLDEGRVDFGSLGQPPALPERRRKKLQADLEAMAGSCFSDRPNNWKEKILPFYDSAYKMSLRPDMVNEDLPEGEEGIDEKAIRGSFLKFFVSILQNYRKYLVYPSKSNPFPKTRFLEKEFIASSEADWREFLQPLVSSQAFHQFVDARLSRSGWTDPEIIFFDESIDAKLNRYMFRLHRLDTPFLSNDSNKHTKTFVAPTVDMQGLEEGPVGDELPQRKRAASYLYDKGFPKLQPHLFVPPKSGSRQSNVKLFGISSDAMPQNRLKRVNTLRNPFSRKSEGHARRGSDGKFDPHGLGPEEENVRAGRYSPACVFSSFLTLWGCFISSGLSEPKVIRAPLTLSQVMGSLNMNMPSRPESADVAESEDAHLSSDRRSNENEEFTLLSKPISPHNSVTRPSASNSGFVHFNDDLRDEYLTITRSAIRIAFELFHVMVSKDFVIDANVYRTLANACAVCGAGERAVDLLRVMLAKKILPDRSMCSAIASAISFSQDSDTSETGEEYLAVSPKDVYEAASNNSVKSLMKHLQSTSHSLDESEFDKLLVDNRSCERRRSKTRFSIFHSRDSEGAGIKTSGLVIDEKKDDDVLAEVSVASQRFSSQILLAERTLDFLFPDLKIDVSHPDGTACPNFKCKKPLSMMELMENYKAFDPNEYTTTCPHCSKPFVPRFTVHSSREDWEGSEGPGSILWCELLSPWVLQKEIMAIIEEHGVKQIVSHDFKMGSSNRQFAVLFWNLIVSFRLYGLPYAFLICEKPSLAFLIPLD